MGHPIRLERVSHRYGESEEAASVEALRAIDLEIAGGEYVALMGPSGSGKSTLLNLLGAVDRATSGSVVIGSTDTSELDERALTLLRRNEIGFIFQFFNLIPTLNVSENIAFPLALQKRPRRETEERVRELVAAVGLEGRAAHFPQQLSGGEMQRVAIARAIVHRPGLILADEPTGNLDIRTGDVILELIDSIHRMFSPTIVMATHSERAVSHAGRVVHVIDGRIEQP